ncbi:MAG: beta-propeller fold lactonase family protein [Deltaproteobacteria bacterium]|nr:beta-propeller fold lactonase family protein [Deltaproteobacteria bacterium]
MKNNGPNFRPSLFNPKGMIPALGAALAMMVYSPPLSSQTVVGKISKTGMKPTAVAVYEKGNKVFISDKTSKDILVYSDTTNKQLATINLKNTWVTNIIVDEEYGKAYCLGENPDWTNETIAVIDAVRNKLIRYIELPFQRTFARIAHDSSIHKVYGLCVGGFIQIDVATDNVTTIPGIKGNPLRDIAVNPVTHDVYISNSKNRNFDIVNGLTLAQSKIPNITGAGLGINPLENKAYIGCYNWYTGTYRLGVYDRDTGKHRPLSPVNDANGFAFHPDGNRTYTSSELECVTSIIEGKTDSVFNMPMESPTGAPGIRHRTNHVYYPGMDYIAVLNDTTQLVEIIPVLNTHHGGIIIQEVAVNQKTGRVYVINDGYALDFVTVIQDEEPMNRPPVYLGTCDQYGYGYEIHVFDPGDKSFVSKIEPVYGAPYHAAAFKPGGGRYYVPVYQMGFKTDTIAEYAGFSSFMSLEPIKTLKSGGSGSTTPLVSPDGRTLYVANSESDDLSVINAESAKLVKRIPVGRSPLGIDITEDGNKVLVANKGEDTLSIIDAGRNTEIARITVGHWPWGVAVTPSGQWAYVANNGSDTVSVIRIKKESVFATIPVGDGPRWLSCSPDGKQVWVGNSASRSLSVIDTGTHEVVKTIEVDGSPEGLCFLPNGREAYIGTGVNLTVVETSGYKKSVYTPKKSFWGLKPIVSAAVGDPSSRFAGTVVSIGVPLRGVLIEAFQEKVRKGRTQTNRLGDYTAHNLPPGTYEIKISKSGYHTQTRKAVVQAGQTKILNVNLKKQ